MPGAQGFSLLEVVLAIGLLAFGVAIALRMLNGSLESVKTARSVNDAMVIVPLVEAKLTQPGIDSPMVLKGGTDPIPLKRRFFDEVFNGIKNTGAIQLLAYPYSPDPLVGSSTESANALGGRFMQVDSLGGGNSFQNFLSSDQGKLITDAPDKLFRIILSASPVNDKELVQEESSAPITQGFSKGWEAKFFAYDITSGQERDSGSGVQPIKIAKMKGNLDPKLFSSLAVRVHILPQPFAFVPGASPTLQSLNKTIRSKDLAFTFDTMLLAY
jgi:hypothetical protein